MKILFLLPALIACLGLIPNQVTAQTFTTLRNRAAPSVSPCIFGWIYLPWFNKCFFLSSGNGDCATQARALASSEFIQLRATFSI